LRELAARVLIVSRAPSSYHLGAEGVR